MRCFFSYSLPFACYGFALLYLILFRSTLYIAARYMKKRALNVAPFYAALWTLPIAAAVHSFFVSFAPSAAFVCAFCELQSGVLYFTFANITIFTSLLSSALHLSLEGAAAASGGGGKSASSVEHRPTVTSLARHIATNIEALTLALVHSTLFGFGIFAVYFNPLPSDWISWLVFILILPLPVVFYILTVRLTEPPRPPSRTRR